MNVIVIDDLPDVVNGLVHGIHWTQLGIHHVFSASDAETAQKKIRENPIDIMLCDIEMPGASGLDLLSWVRENHYNIECLFLTSHADFDYAKKALQLGSFDYILQPAPYAEIENALKKLVNKVLSEHRLSQLHTLQLYDHEISDRMANDLFRESLETDSLTADTFHRIFELKYQKSFSESQTGIVFLQFFSSQPAADDFPMFFKLQNIFNDYFQNTLLHSMLLQYHSNDFFLFLYGDDLNQEYFLNTMHSCHSDSTIWADLQPAFYLGNIVSLENISTEIQQLLHFSRNNIMHTSDFFVYSDLFRSNDDTLLNSLRIDRWEYYLENGYEDQLLGHIKNFFHNSQMDHNSSQLLQILFWKFNSAFTLIAKKKNIDYYAFFHDDKFSFEDYMSSYKNYDSFLFALEYASSFLSQALRVSGNSDEDMISKTIDYIENHIDEDLSRSQLASYVHLNEDYLSRIFKKETGYLLKDFVRMKKIEFAKELLSSTNMSVSLVAVRCGFTNFSHFSQTFKKETSFTPNEYRLQSQKNLGRKGNPS